MNIGEIAEAFIRAAEIDRNTHEHVGPGALRAQQLPYVHDQADKNGWGKAKERRVVKKGKLIQGDWLNEGDDPLAEERRRFFDRMGLQPTSEELARLEAIYDWLAATDDHHERRALLAWARSKVGGKSFRRWCFTVEGIHPETGRRRKDRALDKIQRYLSGRTMQHDGNTEIRVLHVGTEIGDVSDTLAEDAGKRDSLNSWSAFDAFAPFMTGVPLDFSWAEKRNERRRQLEARKRKDAERQKAAA